MPQANIKPVARKRTSRSNTVFSLYFKIELNKIHAAKTLASSLHFLFRCDQNRHFNLTSRTIRMCEQIFKKNIACSLQKRLETELHLHFSQSLTELCETNYFIVPLNLK